MAMNIAKLQSQLQHVPDQALIGYVQNPDGQVPSYLALAELSRRKEIRSGGAQQAQQGAQPSVAQQMMQEAPAEAGVAGLPVPDQMFTEKAMAAGGIVAFEDGGEVVHAYNSLPKSYYDDDAKNFRLSDPNLADPSYDYRNSKSYQDFLKSSRSSDMVPYEQYAAAVKAKSAPVVVDPAEVINQATLPKRNIKPLVYDAMPSTPVVKEQRQVAPQASPAPPIGDLVYAPPKDVSATYDTMMRPDESAQAAMGRYQGLMGIDPNQARMQERLKAMEGKTAKEEETAPWMALAKAGLGMAAGKSQHAIQNIAEGASAGIADLAASKDKIANARDKQFDIASRLAAAERAEKLAAATYGLNSEEATKAHNERVKLAKVGYQADLAATTAKGEFEARKGNLERDLETAKLGEEKRYHDLWYKSNMEKTNKDVAMLEKSIRSNETTQLRTLMSEAGDRLDKLVSLGTPATDPLYAKSLEIYNNAASALGLKAGVKTDPAATGPRAKPLSAFGK